ncbi:MAG: precorrin-4 C(11)-methyltransferase [Tissierellia bacterium]|mgnify:CR=1 FL=1|nr:precorrin-4 C(11)-methyltransferase [Tissierellia bacterium]
MIYFVGAGPGDPDLITVKGRKLLERADMVIYAGSLVSKTHLDICKAGAEIFNSAKMTLEEVIEKFKEAEEKGWLTVRLHTGDPSIYGAIQEQIDIIEGLGFEYEVVPGVSSFTAAASVINREFTLPGVSQTVILTRQKGRTDVPEEENITSLAKHKASMAIFLSVANIDSLVEELIEGYGRDDVPCAAIYKATWPEEKAIIGSLSDIAGKVKAAGIKNHTQILVGDFILSEYERSKLYDPSYSHAFRKGSQ